MRELGVVWNPELNAAWRDNPQVGEAHSSEEALSALVSGSVESG